MIHGLTPSFCQKTQKTMGNCANNERTSRYLPDEFQTTKKNLDNDFFFYDCSTKYVDYKLLEINPYRSYLKEIFGNEINENNLTSQMLDVLKSYTNSLTNECYMKTNLNLLSGDAKRIDWDYVNQLRSLIRGLTKTNIKHAYYRGLNLSDREIEFYMSRRNDYFYTLSFLSFTTDRLLIYPGNALIILKTDFSSDRAKKNLANIWQWSACSEEKEALLAMGSRLKVVSVHYFGSRWEIELELVEDPDEIVDN